MKYFGILKIATGTIAFIAAVQVVAPTTSPWQPFSIGTAIGFCIACGLAELFEL